MNWPLINPGILSDHQTKMAAIATSKCLGVLSGSPGTGKSFTAAQIVLSCIRKFGQDKVCVAAPTGRAAVRMTEAMSSYGIPISARTIHSTLGVQSVGDGDGWSFKHNAGNPLPYKAFVIDEASMLGTGLAYSLFSAFPQDALVLLVGDVHQLPPVEHGAPLRDMIAAGVPYGELSEIHRNDGGIVEACCMIRKGLPFEWKNNLHLVAANTPAVQIEKLISTIDSASREHGVDPVWDMQGICAVNKNSEISRKALNVLMQNHLNTNPVVRGCPFRLEDKVVNTRNGWLPPSDEFHQLPASETQDVMVNDNGYIYVANGDFGRVIRVEPNFIEVSLQAPRRIVIVPRGKSDGKEESEEDTGTGCNWELGYFVSCHKFQGAEIPIAIVMLDESKGACQVCSREWLLTALSRAKQQCYGIGKDATAQWMVRRTALARRKTFLKHWIQDQLIPF